MLTDAEKQKLAAALEQLETERRRREDEKIAAGEAIRVPFAPVVGCPGEDIDAVIERLKAREIEKLRANGETREILFEEPPECSVIVTGVPRNGEFTKWKQESFGAEYPSRYATTRTVPPRKDAHTCPDAPAALVWTRFLTTIAAPKDERDCGIVAEARYTVDGKMLHVEDQQGRIFSQEIRPGDNVEHAARRLLREKFGKHHAFNAPIHYPPRSYH